jgi:hypothetical protein
MSNEEWIYVSTAGVIQPIAHMTDGRLVDVYRELLSCLDHGEPLCSAIGDPVRMLGAIVLEMEGRGLEAANAPLRRGA